MKNAKKNKTEKTSKNSMPPHLDTFRGLALYDQIMARLDEIVRLPDNVYFGRPPTELDEKMFQKFIWLVMDWRHDVRELFKSYVRGDEHMTLEHGLTCDQQDSVYLEKYLSWLKKV